MKQAHPFFQRTLIIGGSMAGMLAATVLARHSGEVLIVEKDRALDHRQPRAGVPQGRQVHTLLAGGMDDLEYFFPTLRGELLAAGAVPVDFCRDLMFMHYGVWKRRGASDLLGTIQTRPLLEQLVRSQVARLPNVRFIAGTRVRSPLLSPDGKRIAGAACVTAGREWCQQADLLVDATGRGSMLPAWLVAQGFSSVQEERVPLDLQYAGRLFRPPAGAFDWRALLVYPKAPREYCCGMIFPVEEGRWLVGLAGYHGHAAGPGDDGFLQFARTLPTPLLHQALQHAQPLSPICRYRFRYQYRRRYEQAARLPDGLLVLGDALCSLDPLFGQGMTVIARQARQLEHGLAHLSGPEDLHPVQAAIARVLALPWLLTGIEAQRYPQSWPLSGAVPPQRRLLQWYAARIFALSECDADAHRAFLSLMHLRAGLGSVVQPWLLRRVCAGLLPRWSPPPESHSAR